VTDDTDIVVRDARGFEVLNCAASIVVAIE
jgi:hypothetical protein